LTKVFSKFRKEQRVPLTSGRDDLGKILQILVYAFIEICWFVNDKTHQSPLPDAPLLISFILGPLKTSHGFDIPTS